ncbi:MAG: M56 family metallopeptidase [Bacteroidaceae bacterium]|nr:M56 family metallopeptidase [Bacteroides sp.]MBQ8867926.1 M56 family metallopeptidase [Bacteroidaceae bacterium]
MTSSILLIAGRFLLASALLMALYWVVWRKQATYRAKRTYLLTMPAVALAIALLQVEVYKPEPVVVEITTELSGPSPIPSQGRGVDTPPIMNLPTGEMADTELASNQLIEDEASSATLSEGQSIPLPPLGEGKGWGPWSPWGFGLLYSLIVLMLCIPFVVNVAMVRRLRRGAHEERDKANDICILTGEDVKAPFSFHRTIFLPQCLTEAQRRMILAHERGHILHRHYIDVWVAEAVTRLLWFNPFLWWARQELRNVHEFEADSDVLGTGEDVYAYQAILIEEVLHGDVVIANGFNHSFIRRRFIEMLQSTNHRMTSLGKAGTTAWMMLVIALMCCTVSEAETIYKKVETQSDISQGGVAERPQPVIIEHTERKGNTTGSDTPLPTFEEKRDSLLWAHANSVPTDFKISIRMKSKEEQKLFERFMGNWLTIVDHNGWLERGEIPTHESLTEEEERNCIVKAREHFRKKLTQTLSQIDAPLRDTLNQFLEKFGLDFVLPKGKGFMVVYTQENGEPKFWGRPEQKNETAPADSGQWVQAVTIQPQKYVTQALSQLSEEHAGMLLQLFSTMNSIGEITTEQYESLEKAYPPGALPSLDSINSNVREIKKSLNTLMLEGMTGMQTGLRKRLMDMLQERGLDTLTSAPRERRASTRVSFSRRGDAQDPHYRMSEYEELAKTDVTVKRHYSTLMATIKVVQSHRQATLANKGLTLDEAERRIREFTQKTFSNAGITLEPNGGYRLSDGTLVVEDGEGGPLPEQAPEVATPKAHMLDVHLPTAPFTFDEYQQMTPKLQLVRHAQETHLICYECPQQDKETIGLHRGMYLTDTDTGDKYMLRRVQGIDDGVWSVEVNNYNQVPLQVTYVFPPLGTRVKEVTVNFPHKSNETHRVKSIEAAQVKVIRDNALWAACINPVEGDGKPENSIPSMKRDKSPNYDVQNSHTYPVYTGVHTTRQQVFHHEKDHYRVYRGKGCTYVTATYKVRMDWEFFNFSNEMMLIDPTTGNRYMVAGMEHFPLNTHFWVNGQQGEYIRFVLVFPELPESVTTVDLFQGGGQRQAMSNLASRYRGLAVQREYTPTDKEKQGRVIY